MKDIFKKGFFGMLVILLVGITGIAENSADSFGLNLNDQDTVEQTVDAVPVQYTFTVSSLSFQPESPERYHITSLSESQLYLKLKINKDSGTNAAPLELVGIRDETLSTKYWSESKLFILNQRHIHSTYFT